MHALRALRLAGSAALAALIFSSAQTAFARRPRQPSQPRLVEEVNVSGTRRLARAELLRHIKTRPGDPFDEQQIQRDLQSLAGLRVFDRRSLRVVTETGPRGGVVVSFEVRELPVVESVRFEGLPPDDEWALREGLRRRGMEVRADDVLDTDKLNAVTNVMERILRGRGWYNVAVETRTEQVSATAVKLTFVVRALPPERRLAPKKTDRLKRRDAIA